MKGKCKTMIDVSIGVCLKNGRFFMSQRSLHDLSYPGTWNFPGGKIERGESPRRTLIREFAEGLGLKIVPDNDPYAICKIDNYLFYCFTTAIILPKHAKCLDATIGFGWFTAEEITHLGTTTLTIEALRSLP